MSNRIETNWAPYNIDKIQAQEMGVYEVVRKESEGRILLVYINPYGVFYYNTDGSTTYSSREYFDKTYKVIRSFPNAKVSITV